MLGRRIAAAIYARINQKLPDRSEHLNFRHLSADRGREREDGVEEEEANRTLKNALDPVVAGM